MTGGLRTGLLSVLLAALAAGGAAAGTFVEGPPPEAGQPPAVAVRDPDAQRGEATGRTEATQPLDVPDGAASLGLLGGALAVAPKLSLHSVYTTNALKDSSRIDGVRLVTAPALTLRTGKDLFGGAAGGEATGSARLTRYLAGGVQSLGEYLAGGSVFVRPADGLTVTGGITVTRQQLSQGSLNAVSGASSTVREGTKYSLGVSHAPGPLETSLRLSRDERRYAAVSRGGQTIDLTGRDNDETIAVAKLAYKGATSFQPHLLASVNRNVYVRDTSRQFYDRDSRGWQIAAGLQAKPLAGVSVSGQLGLLRQDYDDPRFSPVVGPVGNATLRWDIAADWAATLEWSRMAAEYVYPGTPGIFVSGYGGRLSHQWSSALLLEARLDSTVQRAIQLPVTYRELTATVGGAWTLAPWAVLEFGYMYDIQYTSTGEDEYTAHSLGAGLTVSF
ncbi:hypothetical protein J2847_000977 [Azospirillum agricola]|uniref:outer membrane beta-barrel protein n=1 Tax=Azospirillum agricola TaxID=1720247 RepID=UPI001AE45877|nr:outer membrane beta-barrel protein [Azospirillum agricola]MBP2227695.1 hypothetical protein [Azospirillum agricola]